MSDDHKEIADLYARLFIARPDVKAIQTTDGGYMPDVVDNRADIKSYRPWSRTAIVEHLNGVQTYGHYMLSKENDCKFFAFDVDLNKTGLLPTVPIPIEKLNEVTWTESFAECDPREVWKNRRSVARPFIKQAMRSYAHIFQRAIDDLHIPSAVAYTGNKGFHVYGFTGKMPAVEVREAAALAMENLKLAPLRGKAFFAWTGYHEEYDLFTVEVFPKQDVIANDGGFGNLMRLPMGVNKKNSSDPCFFVDTNAAFGVLQPTNPLALLKSVAERVTE